MGSLQQQSVLKGKNVPRGTTGGRRGGATSALIHQIFCDTAAAHSQKTALIYDDNSGNKEQALSYGELDKLSNKIAKILTRICEPYRNDMKNDPVIAVSIKPSIYLPVTLLSILKSGIAYLPLDAEFPSSRVKHILQEAQPLMVIIDDIPGNY